MSRFARRQLITILPELDADRFFTELAGVMQNSIPDQQALNDFGRRWTFGFLGPTLKLSDEQWPAHGWSLLTRPLLGGRTGGLSSSVAQSGRPWSRHR